MDTDREKMIYDTITDDELLRPISELSDGRVAVIQHVLRGPCADDLLERIDRLNGKKD